MGCCPEHIVPLLYLPISSIKNIHQIQTFGQCIIRCIYPIFFSLLKSSSILRLRCSCLNDCMNSWNSIRFESVSKQKQQQIEKKSVLYIYNYCKYLMFFVLKRYCTYCPSNPNDLLISLSM